MSSTPTPVTPATAPVPSPSKPDELQDVEKDVEEVFSLGKSHLVLIILLGLALLGSVYLWDSRRAQDADQRAEIALVKEQVAEEKAVEADKTNAAVQLQNTQQQAMLSQMKASMDRVNATLAQAVADRDAALHTQTTQIITLAPSALATQWGAVAQEPTPSLDTSGNFTIPLPLAQKSYSALIAFPVLTQDVKDLQATVDNQKTIIVNDGKALTLEQQAHLSDNQTAMVDKTALGAKIDKLNAQIVKVKADARKSKLRWFGAGYVAGFVTGIFVK